MPYRLLFRIFIRMPAISLRTDHVDYVRALGRILGYSRGIFHNNFSQKHARFFLELITWESGFDIRDFSLIESSANHEPDAILFDLAPRG